MLCSRELPARSLRRRCGDEGGAAIACPVFPAPAPRRGRGALTRTGHVVGAVWGSQANPINQTYNHIKARPPAHARSTAPTPHRPSSDNLTLSFHVHA